jgi:hypothetical protein
VSRYPSAESIPPGRTVAVTAIEHGDIIITVASSVREPEPLPSAAAKGPFVTTILGGPLCGETWAGETWSTMLRNHAGAVSRVAEFVASEQDGQSDVARPLHPL